MLTRMSNDVERRVLNQEFAEYKASREAYVNERVKELESKMTTTMYKFKESMDYKLEEVNQNQAQYESQMTNKLREIDAGLAVRPVENSMREAIRDACKKTAHDIEEPLNKEIKEVRHRIETLDGDLFRLKNSQHDSI